jgi:hypothetical protein
LLIALAMGGCIRFSEDTAAGDAAHDAANDVSEEIINETEASSKADAEEADASDVDALLDGGAPEAAAADAGDAADAPPDVTPICQRFDPSIAQAVASDMVSALLADCRIRSAFTALPPIRLEHFEDCFAAQIASVLGCLHTDGTRFKYPAYDTKGQFCRDMKTAHAGLTASDGDYDAFLAAISSALSKNRLTDDEIVRVMRTFGASTTRADIVKLKDAGPTQAACEGGTDAGGDGEAGREGGRDAAPEVSPPVPEPSPEAGPTDGGTSGSND